ncbi:MAG TPA: D-glycerate dehydrogenase [Patescibacteria group bacterium]|nr:D-glycerate dehydrogenase [Patescibacteria group bacterium]
MKILVTRKIPGNHIQKLIDAHHDVVVSDFDRPLTAEELVEKIRGVDVILSQLTDKIDAEVMDAAGPQLKLISNYAVGFDNINLDDAKRKNIYVTNTPCDEVNVAVAEHTIALILNIARRVSEADHAVHEGAYHGWEPDLFVGESLMGKTLGVIGLGRIGKMAAVRAHAFGMNVIYSQHHKDENEEFCVMCGSLDELFMKSDFISLHVPLNEETRHIINELAFSKMKDGVFLVNTARGPIVDEHALVQALRSGKVKGAALDVFDNEPEINPELMGMENVILTPHIASATNEARNKMGELAVNAILDVASGKVPQNLAK